MGVTGRQSHGNRVGAGLGTRPASSWVEPERCPSVVARRASTGGHEPRVARHPERSTTSSSADSSERPPSVCTCSPSTCRAGHRTCCRSPRAEWPSPGLLAWPVSARDSESALVDSIRSMAAVGFALAVPLAVLASRVIDVVYGPRWHPAAAALTFLALLGGLRIMLDLAYDLLAGGLGRSSSLLLVQLAWFAGLLVALPVGASVGGIEGVGIAHLLVACCVVAPLYGVAIHRTGISIRASVAGLGPIVLATVACVAFHPPRVGGRPWSLVRVGHPGQCFRRCVRRCPRRVSRPHGRSS